MQNIASQLLQKVKNTILTRDSDIANYVESFANPKSFITATINGKQEFVPISLLGEVYDKYHTLLDIYRVFGAPETNAGLNMRLKEFYAQHGIEWPADTQEDKIGYYIRPKGGQDEGAFFDIAALEKLSNYAGTRYKASDAFLKDLGNTYADHIVDKTNEWVDKIDIPDGYVIEHERYWQVAGRFKSFTWAKVYKEEYQDKKTFFSVGVDVANKELVIKLDGLRSGTHKLSNFEIRDFDYFAENKQLSITYSLEQIVSLTINDLAFIASKFIEDLKNLYENVVDFIWNDKVDCSLYKNKLFKLSSSYTSDIAPVPGTIFEKDIIELIISYEQYLLNHAERTDLADAIKSEHEGNLHLIRSFEIDGKPRTILFIATSGGTTAPFQMSREEIEYLGNNLQTFLYHVVEYNTDNHCGKLIIRKGSPTQYAELKSIHYTVKIEK